MNSGSKKNLEILGPKSKILKYRLRYGQNRLNNTAQILGKKKGTTSGMVTLNTVAIFRTDLFWGPYNYFTVKYFRSKKGQEDNANSCTHQ